MTQGAWEEPLPTLTGRAWAFGTVLTLADVLPERYGTLSVAEARRRVFAAVDPELAARLAEGDIIAVEELRGGGPAAALAALRAAGVAAIVARRYDDDMEDVALAAALVSVAVDAPAFIHTGDRVRIDLEAAKVVNLSSGDRAAIRDLDDARRARLRAMLRPRRGL